jgi:hypothetical protein
MTDSKIALVPNGAVIPESFRFFDAYYSNCIVIITKELKSSYQNIWYYQDCPAITIDDWSCLNNQLIDSIKNNIDEYEVKNLEYFNKNISVEGVANYITSIIKKI